MQEEGAELRQEEDVACGHPPMSSLPNQVSQEAPNTGTPARAPHTHPKTPAVFPSPWTRSSQRGMAVVAPGTSGHLWGPFWLFRGVRGYTASIEEVEAREAPKHLPVTRTPHSPASPGLKGVEAEPSHPPETRRGGRARAGRGGGMGYRKGLTCCLALRPFLPTR